MLRLFKTWLILLLITAVPLQAAAAGAMRTCAAPIAAEMMAACQHHDAQPDSASTPENSKSPAKHPACGACSSFCLGELISPCPTLPAAILDGVKHAGVANAALLTGFIPDGPHRPPRPLSA
ncbi:hypothetical protein [Janthinobacterium lividum]|uniref:hypothetical protein n=1 Tax=Janthinobacterium lividum TaxID=29581 RepID=UPI001409134D|nr:hypothetical protein [Janthinobacterium lividum]